MNSVGASSAGAVAEIDAVKSVISDPSLSLVLSDPGKLVLETLKSTAEAAANMGISVLKETATSTIAPKLADMIGISVSELAESVPFFGTAVAAVVKIVEVLLSASDYNRRSANEQCSVLMTNFQVKGSGSILGGGQLVPADIFAKTHRRRDAFGTDPEWTKKVPLSEVDDMRNPMTNGPAIGVEWYASTIGQGLMLLTEGAPCDVSDVNFSWIKSTMVKAIKKPRPYVKFFSGGIVDGTEEPDKVRPYPTNEKEWERMRVDVLNRDASIYKFLDSINKMTGGKIPILGIPEKRRLQLQRLRRAIRDSYKKKGGSGAASDGGVALWILYLDILRDLIANKSITPSYTSLALVRRQFPYVFHVPPFGTYLFGWDSEYLAPEATGMHTCASTMTNQIFSLVEQWDLAAAPRYEQGKRKIEDVKKQAKAIAVRNTEMALKVNGYHPLVGTIVDGVRSLRGES